MKIITKVVVALMLLVPVTFATNCNSLKVPKGASKGLFSVGENIQVRFSQGNLQYQASTNTWRFAEHPWDYLGEANTNISTSNTGWIDLFGWGTGNNPTLATKNNADYGTFAEWGNNAISNGKIKNGHWRTLTKQEWEYVFDTRITPSGCRFAKAEVNGAFGIILLPDDWKISTYELVEVNNDDFASNGTNVISDSQWSILQNAGAVFLPAAGYREGTSVDDVGDHGSYWSADSNESHGAYYVLFSLFEIGCGHGSYRYTGQSVRLVCPAM